MDKEYLVFALDRTLTSATALEIANWKATDKEAKRFIRDTTSKGSVLSLDTFMYLINTDSDKLENKLIFITNQYE